MLPIYNQHNEHPFLIQKKRDKRCLNYWFWSGRLPRRKINLANWKKAKAHRSKSSTIDDADANDNVFSDHEEDDNDATDSPQTPPPAAASAAEGSEILENVEADKPFQVYPLY